ncbi:hypothetical protein BASA61_000121 [Batrachochytrium salamandrivorans]|nr:hypothetical protein BASA61_000121 [Batrachochytrium salamandrivorans]
MLVKLLKATRMMVDGANQASGSNHTLNKTPSLPLRADYLSLKRPLQESDTPDQSGASSSADFQLEVECTGGRWLRKISKSCSQQQSPPELRPSTLHDPPQSDEMSLPATRGKSEVESYRQGQNTDQYVNLLRMSIPNPLVGSEEQSVAQCMSSRPANLLFPHEFALQMYLSRPGRENPYVPTTFDYIALEDEYILVMEHLDEKWSTLSKYVEKKGQLDIEEARNIIKEIVKAMISLKQHGVVHGDLNAGNVMYNTETNQVKLIDFGVSAILPGWEGGKSVPLKSSDPPSPASEYKAGMMNCKIWTSVGWTGTVEHESMGTRHDNRALAARLADFPAGSVPAVSIHIVDNTTWDHLVGVG